MSQASPISQSSPNKFRLKSPPSEVEFNMPSIRQMGAGILANESTDLLSITRKVEKMLETRLTKADFISDPAQ